MARHLYTLIFCIFFAAAAVSAQDVTPTPTPTLTPVPTPTPVANPTPVTVLPPVSDSQGVRPEDIKVPAVAPNYRAENRTLPDLGRVGVDATNQHPMTLRDALTMALESNNDITVSRQNIRIAEFDLKAARGVYEPRFAGQSYWERAPIPNLSFFNPGVTQYTNNNLVLNAGVNAYVPKFGTVLNVSTTDNRLSSTNPISIFSPQLNTAVTASITQPLFRGRSFDQQRRTIEIAKRNISLTDAQLKQRTIETVANVERAYWDLTYALRNLQVQRDSLKDAQAQLEHNRRLVEEGQLAPIDVTAAETQVANFEQAVYDALNVVNLAENNLKNLISPNRTNDIWSQAITPVDTVEIETPRTTLTEAEALALKNRPEIEIIQAQKDINAVDQRFFREQKKPQIDLVASYTSSGVGGTLNPNFSNPFSRGCEPGSTDPSCIAADQALQTLVSNVGAPGTALTDVLAQKYPAVRVGVQFNLPLFGDKTARAQYGRSLVEGERLETQRAQVEQAIEIDVRNALQAVRTAEARLRAAAIARENSQKQYESEQRKLDEGQSDVYRVLERQTALTVARSNELRARTDLNKAITDLQRATGNTLDANGIAMKQGS
jgi:HAE1 family hydrophobic/amphiphilic exporter-1